MTHHLALPHLFRPVEHVVLLPLAPPHRPRQHPPLGALATQQRIHHFVAHAAKRAHSVRDSEGRRMAAAQGGPGRRGSGLTVRRAGNRGRSLRHPVTHSREAGDPLLAAAAPQSRVQGEWRSILVRRIVTCKSSLPAFLLSPLHTSSLRAAPPSLPPTRAHQTTEVHQSLAAALSSSEASPPGGEKAQHLHAWCGHS